MWKKWKVWRHIIFTPPPSPLSQTVTLSQTPSPLWSVTYFMDGPTAFINQSSARDPSMLFTHTSIKTTTESVQHTICVKKPVCFWFCLTYTYIQIYTTRNDTDTLSSVLVELLHTQMYRLLQLFYSTISCTQEMNKHDKQCLVEFYELRILKND